jgi:IstB-like ATP binding protein
VSPEPGAAHPDIATALFDRLLHHAIVIQLEGSSYRLRQHADLVPDHIHSNAADLLSTAPIKRHGRLPKARGPDRLDG